MNDKAKIIKELENLLKNAEKSAWDNNVSLGHVSNHMVGYIDSALERISIEIDELLKNK